MKKYLFLILAVFFFPVVVHAEEISVHDLYYNDDYGGNPLVLHEGDEITFSSGSSSEYRIFIDGEAVTDFFDSEDGNYVVPKDIYYQGYWYHYNNLLNIQKHIFRKKHTFLHKTPAPDPDLCPPDCGTKGILTGIL